VNLFEEGFAPNFSEVLGLVVANGLKIILLIIAFVIVSPVGKKIIRATLARASKHNKIAEGRTKTLEKLLINVFSYTLIFIFIAMIFGIFEIDIAPLLAGAGIIGLAIGFGAQGLVSDIVTGFFLLLEKQIDVDDYVTTGGYDGIVEEVGLRTTKIRSFDGTLNYVPNRNISGVSNHSRGTMRALVDIGISYDENMDEAMMVLQQVCDEFSSDERVKEGPNVLGVQTLGSSDVVLRIIGHTENMEQWAVERDLRKRMKEALDTAGIEIPYPHQVNLTK
jgi:small-conductance mechanosensitive channel